MLKDAATNSQAISLHDELILAVWFSTHWMESRQGYTSFQKRFHGWGKKLIYQKHLTLLLTRAFLSSCRLMELTIRSFVGLPIICFLELNQSNLGVNLDSSLNLGSLFDKCIKEQLEDLIDKSSAEKIYKAMI